MALNLGRDFWCAYNQTWVCESEFNGDSLTYYHEPEKGVSYMAKSQGKCQCLTCTETDKIACQKCNNANKLKFEKLKVRSCNTDMIGNITGRLTDLVPRCVLCMAQYKTHGKLR